ncbi:MAG: type I methionyl aminopeptidase [Nitriliruptoraceae bacterium]
MIVRKTAKEIERLRHAGKVVAEAHERMRAAADVGVTMRELDAITRQVISEHGATSAFLGYQPHFAPTPFPGVICASVNDVVVHGFPDDRPLEDGDLVSIDVGIIVDGWVGDAAVSFIVGEPRPQDAALVDHTWEALHAGIAAAEPGNRLGDVGYAIQQVAERHGYGIPEGWGGHGVGREMHEDPSVPNVGQPGRGLKLKPGLVIAIEPMFMAGGRTDYRIDDDGWTVRTSDGSRAAHTEHTIAITADGPQILTRP